MHRFVFAYLIRYTFVEPIRIHYNKREDEFIIYIDGIL